MKVTRKYLDGQFTVEADGENQREIFAQLAQWEEVLGEKYKNSPGPYKLVHRVVDDNPFYELHHIGTPYKVLRFGCHKKGNTLFPKRTDDNEKPLPDGGWEDPFWVKNKK